MEDPIWKIDLLDHNLSTIDLADVTLSNLARLVAFDGDGQDHSGNERHGQIIGNGAFGKGRFDKALDLQNGGVPIPEERSWNLRKFSSNRHVG